MEFDGFDWDNGNREKCMKHEVSLSDIETMFAGVPRIGPDLSHSVNEQRFRAIGKNADGRHLFVVFTIRRREGRKLVRPISARFMHRKEIEAYEKAVS